MNSSDNPESQSVTKDEKIDNNRRRFLANFGKATVATATTAAAFGIEPLFDSQIKAHAQSKIENDLVNQRAQRCLQLRVDAAQFNFNNTPETMTHQNNGDEALYSNKIANYSKGLPHNSNGEVNLTAYNALTTALNSGVPAHFEQIPLGGTRKLVNPQAGLAFDMEGKDAQGILQQPAPAFTSREIAAEISENYWMALLRDVPFTDYENNQIAIDAAADLSRFGRDFKGPRNQKKLVTPRTLFRGLTVGDSLGPLMSQFWYLPCFFGANEVSQRIRTVKGLTDGGRDYMTTFDEWLSIQNGVAPSQPQIFDSVPRYMRNGRDLGEWVHIDVLFQGYFQAFLIMAGYLNTPVDSNNPYRNSVTQDGFGTFGGPYFATLLCEVATRALKAVWFQKWFVHRRLRPEVLAARVHRTAYNGANYPVHAEILDSVTSSARLGRYLPSGNALLPMAFPEGSPLHPAYGAGHATVAGACVTILKALFDENTPIPNPVVPTTDGTQLIPYNGSDAGDLTVGGELNKIASNVALGRNMAGVHWRSDATQSLLLGEAVAISILRDQKGCVNENFNGFTLTKFDGSVVTV